MVTGFLPIIFVIIGGGLYFWFDSQNRKRKNAVETGEPDVTAKTAQDFVNIKDVKNSILYTIDGKAFAVVSVQGVCLELFSDSELRSLSNNCSRQLSKFNRQYKYIAVSRRVDLSKTLSKYEEMYRSAEGGRKALIRQEMADLADLEMSGETLEREHFFVVWCDLRQEKEQQLLASANELAACFTDNGIKAKVIGDRDIVKLCGLINVPDYAHIESSDIDLSIAAFMNAG